MIKKKYILLILIIFTLIGLTVVVLTGKLKSDEELIKQLQSGNTGYHVFAFNQLVKRKSKKELVKLFRTSFLDIKRHAGESIFRQNNYLYKRAMSGDKWEFSMLIDKIRYKNMKKKLDEDDILSWANPFNDLKVFDSYNFEENSEQWEEWYNRIHKVLPKISRSSSKEFFKAINNKDPYVRLFAIKNLLDLSKNKEVEFPLKSLYPFLEDKNLFVKFSILNQLLNSNTNELDLTKLYPFLDDRNEKTRTLIFDFFEEKSSFSFDNNIKICKEWYKRILTIFPEMDRTNLEKLKKELNNEDYYVRLFILQSLFDYYKSLTPMGYCISESNQTIFKEKVKKAKEKNKKQKRKQQAFQKKFIIILEKMTKDKNKDVENRAKHFLKKLFPQWEQH